MRVKILLACSRV